MNSIVFAVISVSAIGVLSAIILTVASKIMAVSVDERFPMVRGELPGANCGACGYAGCDSYAQALIDSSDVKTNLCTPGGSATAQKLSEVLGREFESVEAKVAVVCCSGDNSKTGEKVEFKGDGTCKAAKFFYGGKNSCTYGCLGLGDCAKVCPYGAICVQNGLAYVDPEICTGCGACVDICPARVIRILPKGAPTFIGCNSCDKGPAVKKVCSIGCISCTKCVRECPQEAITMVNNLPVIDYDKCNGCQKCVEVCISKCIHSRV